MLSINTPSEIARILAQRARQRRLDCNWSREELAKRSQVTAASIKRFELSGQISLSNLLKICLCLNALEDFNDVLSSPAPKTMAEIKKQVKARQRGRTKK